MLTLSELAEYELICIVFMVFLLVHGILLRSELNSKVKDDDCRYYKCYNSINSFSGLQS